MRAEDVALLLLFSSRSTALTEHGWSLVLCGCATVERSLVDPEVWGEPREGVAVSKAGIRIGSTVVELPTTEGRLSEVLGRPDRSSELENRILVWDRLGIFAYEEPTTRSINAISISFACRDMEYCPEHAFPGALVVGDAVFMRAPDTRDIVRNHFKSDEFTCFKRVGKYQVSVDCIEGGLGLGTFEIALK